MKTCIYACIILFVFLIHNVFAQKTATSASVGNPVLPGYFADPTIKKIGDTYYLYATTDGNGGGFGPSQVWTSKDFVHWAIQPMNWPNTHWYWAPDMTKGYDGRYYLYYSQPVELFGAVSDTPVGPWISLAADDKAIVPNYMIPGVITLDGQTFTDDDGKIYMFWGTWGIYPEHGCAVGLLNQDMKTFERIELIPNTIAKDFFEAPIMFKREGIYYLLYSSGHCEDHTYRVQYVKSKSGPFGPYEYPEGNPILVTNEDGSIHGPGHNGIIEENGKHYIVYHRHNNPHAGGGFHRQVAADELLFDENGNIKKVVPTHEGIGFLGKNTRPFKDLAFGKAVSASSVYSADFKPEFAVDHNNGTLWRAANNAGEAWLQIDLGKLETVQTVLLEMEYPTYAYQYTVEVSADGEQWNLFSDQRKNDKWASPIIALGDVKIRYVRLTIANTQVVGLPRGVWNVKVYGEDIGTQTRWSPAQEMPALKQVEDADLLILDAADYVAGNSLNALDNKGILAGKWQASTAVSVKNYQGRLAFYFDGANKLQSDFAVPESMDGNAAYTVSMWVNNPEIARVEPLISWSRPGHDLTLATYGYGADKASGVARHGGWADMGYDDLPKANEWQHIVISFDGYMERLYVNGELTKEQNKMLFVRGNEQFTIAGLADDFFSGYLSSLRVANSALTSEAIQQAFKAESKTTYALSVETADLPFGKLSSLPLYGRDLQAGAAVAATGEVHVCDGRIGLSTKGLAIPQLRSLLALDQYTVVLDVHDGKAWTLVVVRREKGNTTCYIDGKSVSNSFLLKNGTLPDDIASWNTPVIHGIQLFSDAKSDQGIADIHHAWQDMIKAEMVRKPLAAAKAPYRINDKQLFAGVQGADNGLRYLLTYGRQKSGWRAAPHALFDYDRQIKSVEAMAKDIFGNVSATASFTLSPNKPVYIPAEKYSFDRKHAQELPFWNGMALPVAADSMQVAVTAAEGVWRLASKDTKWGGKEAIGPFLYKNLADDFTMEVQILDVAGKSAGTRTSGEAGLMVQDAANPSAYLNNTVLTGWNLGNLVRSIGPSVYREANTGVGLDYQPYLQIQKVGALFYLRSSIDGMHWVDLPNSPFVRPDLDNKELDIGIYQVANNNQLGYGLFKAIKIWRIAR